MNRQFLSIALITTFVLPPSYAIGGTDYQRVHNDTIRVETKTLPEVEFQQTGPNSGVQTLRGAAAILEIQSLRARNPRPFMKAAADLSARGFQPTQTAVVVRSMRLTKTGWIPSPRSNSAPFMRAQQESFYGPEGEVAFWSWDDGNNATWEGTIYCENYTNGVINQFDDQVSITTDSPSVLWEDLVYEGRIDGGGGPRQVSQKLRTPAAVMESTPYHRVYLSNRDYLGCVIGGVLGVAMGCALTGPGWLPCFVSGATAVVIACLIMRVL